MKNFLIASLLIIISGHAMARSLVQEARSYIQYYESKYPRTELHFDELKSQMLSPKEKSQVGLIYEDNETIARATQLAQLMDPMGPQNNYEDTLEDLLKIYFSEPQHRRAVQSIFDAMATVYFSDAQRKLQYKRQTSIAQHMIDHAQWTWGIAMLWSLRSSPRFLNSQNKLIKPMASLFKKVSPNVRLYKKNADVPLHQQNAFKQLANAPGVRWIVQGAKDAITFTGVTAGTAAVLGVPSYYLYEARKDPANIFYHKHHQMALLQLGCETLDLQATITNTDFNDIHGSNKKYFHRRIKKKINDLADGFRFLQETAYLYNTSRPLNKKIAWDAQSAKFQLDNDSFTCDILKGQELNLSGNANFLNLPYQGRLINEVITSYTSKLNASKFADFDKQVEQLFVNLEDIDVPFSNIYEDIENKQVQKDAITSEAIAVSFIRLSPYFKKYQNHNSIQYLSKSIAYEWQASTLNTYLLHLTKKYYVKHPKARKQLIVLFAKIAQQLDQAVTEGFITNTDSYINPIGLIGLLHDFNFENTQPYTSEVELQ